MKTVYDALPVKWLGTTDDILEKAEIALRELREPATTEQILKGLRDQGFDIFGDGVLAN